MMRLARKSLRRLMPDSSRTLETILINQGRMLAIANAGREIKDIADAEFKVFSQWGEDGIIQHLVSRIPGISKTFIEFGVEDFGESNCRFLMMKDNWRGCIIDGSADNIAAIRATEYHWRYDLNAIEAFITRDNIAELLDRSGFDKDCGILSVDIDGVDYHVLEAAEAWRPAMLIVEYNALFGDTACVTVPYDPSFIRQEKHYSNQYWGASLGAFHHLASKRGYALVGVNSTGSNAFFVRRDMLWSPDAELTVAQAFRPVTFRDARDETGQLSYLSVAERRQLIADLPVLDVVTGETKRIGSYFPK